MYVGNLFLWFWSVSSIVEFHFNRTAIKLAALSA